ncbi:MAG: hypothetical protein JSR78_00205 [Proteobacteria bacterium]|nr:hypothetical protein [Pseudomonadota bacterium]
MVQLAARAFQNLADTSALPTLLLASGGDKRIWLDAATGRNRYGTLTRPAEREISFSSSTASSPSLSAFAAASGALSRLIDPSTPSSVSEDEWFDEIHRSLAGAIGYGDACAILASSGTDAELLGLGIVSALSSRPLTNVFVAPDETGNGVPQAAAGRHFSDITALGASVVPGGEISGLESGRIEACAVAIRDEEGRQRAQADIDADMIATVERELKKGRDVIVHVLDTSKTGLSGVTRAAAKFAAALAPGRVRVIVDACQLRGRIQDLRDDLASGFIVLVTVSKFFGAPPFAGALVLPADVATELAEAKLPAGLFDYTAAQDWSQSLRGKLDFEFSTEMNIGLGLRWRAGLANLERYVDIPAATADELKNQFVDAIKNRAGRHRGFFIHEDDDGQHLRSRGIVSLSVDAEEHIAMARAKLIQTRMRSEPGVICHVGQPVKVAKRAVLRVALSAAHVISFAECLSRGQWRSEAMAPLIADLDILFDKWECIHHELALSDTA